MVRVDYLAMKTDPVVAQRLIRDATVVGGIGFGTTVLKWLASCAPATVIAVANIGICDGKFSSQFPSLIKRRALPSLFAVANMVVTAHCRRQKQRPRPQRRREKCRRHAVAVGLLRWQNDFWRRHFAVAN
ncbi:hypothetical protein ACLB2K_004052 [Fragaria x ananassa]